MNDYDRAWEALAAAIGAAKGSTTGHFENVDHLTVDQRLKVAEIAALLSVSQELSRIHHEGISPEYRPD